MLKKFQVQKGAISESSYSTDEKSYIGSIPYCTVNVIKLYIDMMLIIVYHTISYQSQYSTKGNKKNRTNRIELVEWNGMLLLLFMILLSYVFSGLNHSHCCCCCWN